MGNTYVMSDIHGNIDYFKSVLSQINLSPVDTLYILGDVIDRGAYGIDILRMIMDMPNVKMLLGNHEFMMLDALGEPHDGIRKSKRSCQSLWYSNGGGVTHLRYIMLPQSEQRRIVNYLKSLPLNYEIKVGSKEYTLVHAAPTELYQNYKRRYRSPAEFSVWERDALSDMTETDKRYIFGHTGTFLIKPHHDPEIIRIGNLIGIDCGCALQEDISVKGFGTIRGRLGCLRLEDMKIFYSTPSQMNKRVS